MVSWTWELIGAWVAVGLTIGLYSFLYNDNPVFKLCEHIFVGVGMGYTLVFTAVEYVWPKLLHPLIRVVEFKLGKTIDPALDEGESLWLLVPAVFSLFMLLRFFPKTAWTSRLSFAFIVGTSAGIAIPYSVSANIFQQIKPTFQPLWALDRGIAYTRDTILIIVGVLAVLVYFFFSVEHKGAVRVVARVGIVYLMIAFGAAFGFTVMAREALLIRRVQELKDFAGAKYWYATWVMILVVTAAIVTLELLKRDKSKASQQA